MMLEIPMFGECCTFEARHMHFMDICEKLHKIACFLTHLPCQTYPVGCATPHIPHPYTKKTQEISKRIQHQALRALMDATKQ